YERLASIDRTLANPAFQQDGILTGTARILGQLVDTGGRSLASAAAFGAASAGTVAAAGQLGPQVALPEEIVTVPAAFLTGASIGGIGEMAVQAFQIESGNSYLDMVDAGLDQDAARWASFGIGAVNSALELAGGAIATGLVSKQVRDRIKAYVTGRAAEGLTRPTVGGAARRFAVQYATGLGGEVLTETMQEVANILGEEAARLGTENAPDEPTIAEVGERLYDIVTQTAEGMALLAGVGPAVRLRADTTKAQAAAEQSKFFNELANDAADNKLRQRAPDVYAAFVAETAKDTSVESVYIDASTLQDVLRQNEIPPQTAQETFGDVASAAARGDDVVLPVGDFASNVAGTPVGDALRPHVRVNPDAMSAAEAEAFAQEQDQRVAEVEKSIDDAQAFRESARRVEESIRDQLRAVLDTLPAENDVRPSETARYSAKLLRDFVVTQASDLGITPEEFQARYPLAIQRGEVSGATLQSAGQEGPRGGFSPSRLAIILTEGADRSTFLHEAGHYFFHVYGDLAAQPDAPQRVRDDMQTLL
ncbi:MAG: hypothetical protein HRU13_14295, partial [Phycisphaerales bacterium]|nr:hypothetical protein [Phycisphaerales bacterium]